MKRMLRTIIVAVALGAGIVAPTLAGDKDHELARKALAAGEILPLKKILEIVDREVPGQLLEIELDREDRQWIYTVKVLTNRGGVSKLEVDAANGEIVSRKDKRRKSDN